MGYRRQIRSASPADETEASCLGAYERELDYRLQTLRRLGANPRERAKISRQRSSWSCTATGPAWTSVDPFGPTSLPSPSGGSARTAGVGAARVPTRTWRLGSRPLARKDHFDRRSRQSFWWPRPIPFLFGVAVVIMDDLDGLPMVEVAATLSLTRFGAHARRPRARKEPASALRRLLWEGVR
jgi:hypothetical protein